MMKGIYISDHSVSPTPVNSSPPPVSTPLQLSSEPSQQGRGPVVVGDEGGCSPAPAPSPPAPIFTEPTSQLSSDPTAKLSSDPTAKLSSVPTAKLSSDPTAKISSFSLLTPKLSSFSLPTPKLSSEQVYPTPQLPSEPPQQQEVRGPTAVVGEVGCFPSHDIRERNPPVDVHSSDCRPLGAIIEEMTAVCRKRKGEDFLPNLRRSENKSATCVVCSRGSICLGNSCLGTRSTRTVSSVHTFDTICIIPGLAGDKSSSLLEREKTPSSKLSKIKISPECSKLLTWRPTDNKQTKSQAIEVEATEHPFHFNKPAKIVGGPATNYDRRKLRKILLRANLKISKVQKTSNLKVENDDKSVTTSSILRKLQSSEISCQRKMASPKKLTTTTPTSNSANQQIFKIPPRHPTWGHFLVGLKGGAPPLVVPQVAATGPTLPPPGKTLPSTVVAPDSLPGPALPLHVAASDNPAVTPGRFK